MSSPPPPQKEQHQQQQPASSGFSEDKYKKLKRKLRDIMEVNESMTKEYVRAKKKIQTLTFERNLLLDNITRMEGHSSDDNSSDVPSDLSDTESDLEEGTITTTSHRRVLSESPSQNRDSATVASAPPKRSKLSRLPTKTRRVQPIDRDEQGQPRLPQQIGVLTVLDLGKIVSDRDTFHNERYIFPVGYTVSRTYPSMKDPSNNTVITSTITDGGDGPRFHVIAADQPDEPIIANSATGAWTVVVRKSNEIRQREHSNSASGPDYYGFKHPTIAKLIQDLPGAENLRHYVPQSFEEMEPRAAKGVMAAAEKKRGNLEQMGNANRRAPKVDGSEDGMLVQEDGMMMDVVKETASSSASSPPAVSMDMDDHTATLSPPPSSSSHYQQQSSTDKAEAEALPSSTTTTQAPSSALRMQDLLSSTTPQEEEDEVDQLGNSEGE
ncbi:F/Y rich C-terminus-domain-containing protein [Zychaea mexicana]|uniref:F/Y rich C-terminus-domain-containing protein n=1 Tax=Zychaea mexicana TaxID=64656 RepID=UPI0022FDD656|nr:F/Y rich C-terminus-domain-containing protein [Zychaea mexicana]KAI9494033.1 F/Y rich C-terminus-domain-containing protein [Zychaea mexicana]